MIANRFKSDRVIPDSNNYELFLITIVNSDEGLTLEKSALQIFHGSNLTFINSFDKTKFW